MNLVFPSPIIIIIIIIIKIIIIIIAQDFKQILVFLVRVVQAVNNNIVI